MIRTQGLTKNFGTVTAVDGLDLEVREGEVFGFLGPNGAGKTTTVRMLAGLIAKTSGTAEVCGVDLGDRANELRLRRQIGLLPENVGLYESTSAYDNLAYFGSLYGLDGGTLRANIERYLKMMGLWEQRDRPVATFSKGMKQKVAIARALVHEPVLLMMDEPTANLDPEAAKTVRDLLLELKKERRTIFLNTHHLDEAERICDRVGIIRTRLLTVGTPDDLRAKLWGRRTRVRVDGPTEALARAVTDRLGPRRIERTNDALVVEVTDPDRENPELVDAIVRAGGRIRELTALSPTLEDVYLRLVREQGGAA